MSSFVLKTVKSELVQDVIMMNLNVMDNVNACKNFTQIYLVIQKIKILVLKKFGQSSDNIAILDMYNETIKPYHEKEMNSETEINYDLHENDDEDYSDMPDLVPCDEPSSKPMDNIKLKISDFFMEIPTMPDVQIESEAIAKTTQMKITDFFAAINPCPEAPKDTGLRFSINSDSVQNSDEYLKQQKSQQLLDNFNRLMASFRNAIIGQSDPDIIIHLYLAIVLDTHESYKKDVLTKVQTRDLMYDIRRDVSKVLNCETTQLGTFTALLERCDKKQADTVLKRFIEIIEIMSEYHAYDKEELLMKMIKIHVKKFLGDMHPMEIAMIYSILQQ